MEWLIHWLVSGLAVAISAYLLPGVKVGNYGTALLVALVLGFVNIFVRPLLLFLTLPINILTLGLFTFVINALMVLIVSALIPQFKVSSFWSALFFGIILAIITLIFPY